MSRCFSWNSKSILDGSRGYSGQRRRRLQHDVARRSEGVEERVMLAADFTAGFDNVFAGQTANVTVDLPDSATGELNAWMDFDGDGQFHSIHEQIFTSKDLVQGSNRLAFAVPFGATATTSDVRIEVSTPDPDSAVLQATVEIKVAAIGPILAAPETVRSLPFFRKMDSADFDGDGDVDAFAANISGSTIHYYRNNGDGQFTTFDTSFDLSGSVSDLDAADINGDGLTDVIVSISTFQGLDLLIQGPRGHFTHVQQPTLENADHSEIADFNGDGHLDIITINRDVQLLLNNGDGSFTASTVDTTSTFPGDVAVGDIDMDGDIDAVVTNSREIILFRNNGSGVMTTVRGYITSSTAMTKIDILDFNLDGLADIVGGQLITGDMFLFQSNGSSYSETVLGIPGGREDVEFGDFNGDGSVDVLTADIVDGTELHLNNGDNSTFTRLTMHTDLSESVQAADFDGDGDLDFVYEQNSDFSITINEGNSGRILIDVSLDSATESSGTVSSTITRPTGSPNSAALAVSLNSSNTLRATVPPTVTIPAGMDSASFNVSIVDDNTVNGDEAITISAAASSAYQGTDQILTIDDDGSADFAVNFGKTVIGTADNVVRIDLTDAMSATIDGWIDFDGDGEYHSEREQIQTRVALVGGVNELFFHVPFEAAAATRNARFTVRTFNDQATFNTSLSLKTTQNEPELTKTKRIHSNLAPESMTSGDFDGDGDVDIFATNINGSKVHYYRNTGDGRFTTIDSSATLVGSARISEAADLNNDGLLDVVVVGTSSTDAVNLFIQGPADHFTREEFATPEDADEVEFADLNGDGFMDIVIANSGVHLLLNDGTGSFTSSTLESSRSPGDLAVGDVDRDGDIDIVATDSRDIVLYQNSGTATFTTVDNYITATQSLENISVVDFDRDGFNDIIAGRFIIGNQYFFKYDGTNYTESALDVEGGRDDVEIGDINGDGFLDLVTAQVVDGTEVWLNTGDNSTFDRITIHGNLSEFVEVADFDGDGDLDFFYEQGNDTVLAINTGTSAASVQINVAATSVVEDAGSVEVTVSRSGGSSIDSSLVVTLTSSDPSRATIPASVTIPAGMESITTNITLIDDSVISGNTTITIAAEAGGITANSDQFVIIDDDTQGFTISETAGSTVVNEGGTDDTFSVVLDVAPNSDVVLNLVSNDTSEAVLDLATLTFTPANWNQAQTVTVIGVDDDQLDGQQESTVTVTIDVAISDNDYAAVSSQQLTVSTTDDEASSLTLIIAADSVAEGSTTTATVNRTGNTSEAVVVSITSNQPSEIGVPLSITIPPGQDTSDSFNISTIEDNILDGNQTITLTVAAAGLVNGSDSFVVTDTTVADFTISETALATVVIENGTTDTFDVVLDAAPQSNVTLTVTSNDSGEAIPNVAALTFTPTDWNQPRTVTVTGVDDDELDGPQDSTITVAIDTAITDTDYAAVPFQQLTVTTIDNEVPSLSLTIDDSSIAEGSTTSATVTRTGDTSEALIVSISNSANSEINIPDQIMILAGQATASFNISAFADAIIEGNQTISFTVTASELADGIGSLLVTDSTVAGFTISETDQSTIVNESGTTDTFDVVLDVAPDFNVTLNFASSDTGEAILNVARLTFTPANWNHPRTVTVTGTNDNQVDGLQNSTITVAVDVQLSDSLYAEAEAGQLTVTTNDDDVPSLALVIAEDAVAEGSATTATVTRTGEATEQLTVSLTGSEPSEIGLPNSITIPAGQATSESFEISAIADDGIDGSQTITITATALGLTSGTDSFVVTDTTIAGNVDGDNDFDASDSFLIQLVMLAGNDSQIDASKGASPRSALQIRSSVSSLETVGDIDGDNDFDANDAFLMQLVKLAGTNNQIDVSKGASPLTASQIRANIDALGGGTSGNSVRTGTQQDSNVVRQTVHGSLFAKDSESQALLSEDLEAATIKALDCLACTDRSWLDVL